MPTYRLTTRNQFRSPSGAVGEAPDGPGALANLADDIDGAIGLSGAEAATSTAARDAIPSTRRFIGKLVYVSADTITYRWDGAAWRPWSSGTIAYTPSINNWTTGNATVNGVYQLVNGVVRGKIAAIFGSTTVAGGTPLFTLPPNLQTANTAYGHVSNGFITDVSAAASWGVYGSLNNAARFGLALESTGVAVSASAPFAWAVNDQIWLSFEAVLA